MLVVVTFHKVPSAKISIFSGKWFGVDSRTTIATLTESRHHAIKDPVLEKYHYDRSHELNGVYDPLFIGTDVVADQRVEHHAVDDQQHNRR